MNLNDQQITELLAQKSSLTPEQVEENLRALKKRLNQLEEDERVIFDELGEFINTNNTLRFIPSDELATEINFKYAGMKPLTIVEANKTTSAAGPHKKDEDSQTEIAAGEDEEEKEKSEKPISPEKTEIPEDITDQKEPEENTDKPLADETSPVFSGSEKKQDQPGDPIEHDKKTAETREMAPTPKTSAANNAKSAQKDTRKGKSKRTRKGFNPQNKAQKDSIFSLVNTLIAIFIIGGLIFLVYKFDKIKEQRNRAGITQQQESNNMAENKSSPADTDQQAGQDVTEGTKNNNTNAATADNGNKIANSAPEESKPNSRNSPIYGLYGDVNRAANNGYTIVVHSLRNKAAALNQKNRLQRQYRAMIMIHVMEQQDTTWRVGIGQFRTVDAALEAAKTLDEPYRTNNFIKRISQ